METETLEKKSSIELAKEKAQKEWIQEDKPKSARFKPAHESLVAWDDARRAREINGINIYMIFRNVILIFFLFRKSYS